MMHAHGTDGINAAIRAGADSIDHVSFLDPSSIAPFKSHMTFLELNPMAGDTVVGAVHRADLGGVRVVFGTYTGVSEHEGNAEEFGLLQAGVSAPNAIRMAIIWGAERVGVSDTLGALKPGMAADVIAVKGDPLSHMSTLRSMQLVMQEGVVYRQ